MSDEASPELKLDVLPYDRDDSLMEATRGDAVLRTAVYAWDERCVVIGRGGKAEVELNLAAVIEDGMTVRRRPGGGCAVYLDPGNVVVSVFLPLPGLGGHRPAFEAISNWLIAALAELGVPGVTQEGVSDLTLAGRKIGGSCIYRTKGLLYYSTTLLVDPDMAAVERYVAHPPREPEYRAGRRHAEFMRGLASLLPGNPDSAEFARRLEATLAATPLSHP